MEEEKRGKIIVIEGTDCSGKETQASLLLERFEKEEIPIAKISFPAYGSPTGDIVGDCYLGKSKRTQGGWFGDPDKIDPKVASLYYAADRRYFLEKIKSIINSGTNLIIDRYYMSNMAHQGGKIINKQEREKLFDWLENLELNLLALPKEDLTIFLYVPTEVAFELKNKRNIIADGHERNIEHIKRAETTYLELAKRYNWIKINCAPGGRFESLRNPKDIHEEVYKKVKDLLSL
ncbi:thymidylate kinase [Candidatus Pacearchaeota archaeon]|nr:thymidylate kinase [Candidatus Pacearchaeota archaeon]MBD3283723.1 thymidylate kinase [Candidatus Pacearchaeota archaeon]